MRPRVRRATRSHARRRARKRSSSGPMPDAESRSGGSSAAASSASASASTASISAMIRSNVRSSVSEISDLPSRLIRFDVDSIESMIRPLRFSFARSSSPVRRLPAAMSAICSTQISTHVVEVLLARADVDADQARVGVLRREAVDRVRHAALLADLLEEPRRRRAAEDGVEQRRGEAAPVGARDARRAEADVVLLGVLALEAEAGRRRLHERPADVRPARAAAPSRALEALRAARAAGRA